MNIDLAAMAQSPEATNLIGPYAVGAIALLARLSALFRSLPLARQGAMPTRARVALLLGITALADMALGGIQVPVPATIVGFVAIMAREVVLGASLGLVIRLVFAAVEGAGVLANTSMGLSLAVFVDPSTGGQSMPLAVLFGLITGLMFLALGGDHLVLTTWLEHARHVPIGGDVWLMPDVDTLAIMMDSMVRTALTLSAPVVGFTLVINISMAFVSRIVPSVNLFGIGLGMFVIGGFLALGLMGDTLNAHIQNELVTLPQRMVHGAGGVPGPTRAGTPIKTGP